MEVKIVLKGKVAEEYKKLKPEFKTDEEFMTTLLSWWYER